MMALRLDGRAVAMKVNLLDAPTSYTYKVTFDATLAKVSPGVALEVESMRQAMALPGIASMDSAGRGENPPFDWLWNARRLMGALDISTGDAASDLSLLGRPAAAWLKRRAEAAMASAKALRTQ
jgi:hypothetical protein